MGIGILDMLLTAVLYSQGLVMERNPLMRPLIEHSEWLFMLVKGSTLGIAWLALAHYARTNLQFVRLASLTGSVAYVTIWVTWFLW
jgi:hypothetical protein